MARLDTLDSQLDEPSSSYLICRLTCYIAFRGQPRGYRHLDEIIRLQESDKSLSGATWEIHVSPDAIGPLSTAGNDWTGLHHISFQLEAERMVALILAQSVENLITRAFLVCHSWSFFLKIRTTELLTS